nr:DEAD/DEAH box helicase family protein [Anabaena sphaerica]
MIENFIFFYTAKGSLVKIVAKNHQFLGVNSAIEGVKKIQQNQGKLGVFWHTQGSGKSYSMVFFSQKILRKLIGNWTFLIITDREDLDDQIYKNFAYAGVVTEPEQEVRAKNAEHLKLLLKEDHRYIFTLIQKFRTDKVKQVARELLEILKREKLVLDWRKRQQTRAGVEVTIKDILDKLPPSYSIEVYEKKCLEVYQHIYENYSERGISIYQIFND